MENFTLGIFLECDLTEDHKRRIESFCDNHASICLISTAFFQLHAFVDTLDEEQLANDWIDGYGNSENLVFFERVKSPESWCEALEKSIPSRLKACMQFYKSR